MQSGSSGGLNELDKVLEKRGHRYKVLLLPINREKSGIRKSVNFTTLGFGFVPIYKKGEKGKYQLIVKKSKWQELKAKLKRITKKTIPASFDERITDINSLLFGWVNYFKIASIEQKLKKLDEWLRIVTLRKS